MSDVETDLARRAALAQSPLERVARMIEIRLFEEEVQSLFDEGVVHGTTHLAQGQEAIAVALASVLEPTDPVTCTYRGHATALALGLQPSSVLAEILGRSTGAVGGLGGSMHLVGVHVGLLPTFAIVGAGLPIATGAGFASMMQGSGRVAVALFGDGATNIGAFHESLNLAAVWKLPVLFLCENNLYGEYSRIQTTTPIDDIASRAGSYAMKSEVVDGQDIDALISVLGRRVAEIRSHSEPVLVEAKTYRFSGHSRSDAGDYRPPGELNRWLERDPIKLAIAALLEGGHASADQIEKLWSQAARTVGDAREFALASPEPSIDSMFASVYAPRPL